MNNSTPQEALINLDFLPAGKYKLHYFRDSQKSNTVPTEIIIGTDDVNNGQVYKIKMEKGGGYAAYLEL
jgi:hypothetical protein